MNLTSRATLWTWLVSLRFVRWSCAFWWLFLFWRGPTAQRWNVGTKIRRKLQKLARFWSRKRWMWRSASWIPVKPIRCASEQPFGPTAFWYPHRWKDALIPVAKVRDATKHRWSMARLQARRTATATRKSVTVPHTQPSLRCLSFSLWQLSSSPFTARSLFFLALANVLNHICSVHSHTIFKKH